MTFPFILQRMLDRIPDGTDKREGGIIYDSLAPAAMELAILYAELDTVTDETFADTAGREMLIRRAAERGISPYEAAPAAIRGEFDINVPIGSRFSSGDFRYRVTEKLSDGEYKLVCESAGSDGDRAAGALVPLDYIAGLSAASVTGLLVPGKDDEDTEHLRKRYFDSLDTQSYGGNIADYRRKALSAPGVGGVKVYPVWNGGGTVKLVIQNHQWNAPSEALINEVQNLIDPVHLSGMGEGTAPIGHSVTVAGVTAVTVDISADFTLAAGWSFQDALPYLNELADDYFRELSAAWDSADGITVRLSQTEARLLNAGGITDIMNLRLNGTAGNITLPSDGIPVRGDIIGVS
jgi:uncharacterized phage protein gp47/JayE